MKALTAMACCLAAGATLPLGCIQQTSANQSTKLSEAEAAIVELQQDNRRLRDELVSSQQQIKTLQALGDKRVEKLPHVERISLGRFTGGIDLDGVPGDDAVRVYLQPVDQQGSIIKAAGEVKVQLFDLAAGPEDNRIAELSLSDDQVSQRWFSGLGTNHFSFDCPWREGTSPAHSEITVRVEFTEYLTGKMFTVQQVCKVALAGAPASQPETRRTTTQTSQP